MSDILRRQGHAEELALGGFARSIRRALNAESCAVFLVRKEGGERLLDLVSEDCDTGYRSPEPRPRLPIQSKVRGGLTSHLADVGRIVRLHGRSLSDNPYLAGNKPLHLRDGTEYSLLSFPLKNRKNQLLGIVKVQNKKDRKGRAGPRLKFSDVDVSLAAFLSSRLAIALQSRETVEFLNTLLVGKAGLGELATFAAKALSQALSLVGADKGSVALWDEKKRALIFEAQEGDGGRWPGKRVPRGVMRTVWRQGKPICIPNVRKYEGNYFESDTRTKSELAVPIAAKDASGQARPLGVLNAESFSLNNFDVEDQEMLTAMGESIATAINSARPAVSLHSALASLSAPARIFADPPKLLRNILERVRDTHGFDRAVIYVVEEMSNLLRLGAQLGCDEQNHLVGTHAHEISKASLAAKVWKSGLPEFSLRPKRDPLVYKDWLSEFRVEGPMLGVPLQHAGKTLGVLICWSSKRPRPSPEHIPQLAP